MEQEKNENIFEFEARLRDQARFCHFVNVSNRIIDKILLEPKFREIRKMAFDCEMDLDQLLTEASRIERSVDECSRCGKRDHYHYSKRCPARNEKCSICEKFGHFKRMCTNKIKRSSRLSEEEFFTKRMRVENEHGMRKRYSSDEIDLSIVKKEKFEEVGDKYLKDPRLRLGPRNVEK